MYFMRGGGGGKRSQYSGVGGEAAVVEADKLKSCARRTVKWSVFICHMNKIR
jgi:hypothetical protein